MDYMIEQTTAYFKSFIPENRFRTPLALIIHEADMRAADIEWEQQYLPTIGKKIKNQLNVVLLLIRLKHYHQSSQQV